MDLLRGAQHAEPLYKAALIFEPLIRASGVSTVHSGLLRWSAYRSPDA